MLHIVETTGFKRSCKKATKQKKNTTKLTDIVYKLAMAIPLEAKNRNHKLSGNYAGKWECHIEPDWLLIYEIVDGELVLYDVGTHSELFGK